MSGRLHAASIGADGSDDFNSDRVRAAAGDPEYYRHVSDEWSKQAIRAAEAARAEEAARIAEKAAQRAQEVRDDQQCKSYGAKVGSSVYVQCRLKLVEIRQAQAQRDQEVAAEQARSQQAAAAAQALQTEAAQRQADAAKQQADAARQQADAARQQTMIMHQQAEEAERERQNAAWAAALGSLGRALQPRPSFNCTTSYFGSSATTNCN